MENEISTLPLRVSFLHSNGKARVERRSPAQEDRGRPRLEKPRGISRVEDPSHRKSQEALSRSSAPGALHGAFDVLEGGAMNGTAQDPDPLMSGKGRPSVPPDHAPRNSIDDDDPIREARHGLLKGAKSSGRLKVPRLD